MDGQRGRKWSAEEEEALFAGVCVYGPGKWSSIIKDPEFMGQLSSRTKIDLKDKCRNVTNEKTSLSDMINGFGSVRLGGD